MKTELDSAWESAIHNAERARKAEAEVERLRAELAECRSKPQELHLHANGDSIDCRTCDRYTVFHSGYLCGLTKSVAVIVCIKGDAYIPADPVRLYETGGE